MAKSSPAAVAAKKSGPSRTRRNALERKSLSKASKRLYGAHSSTVFKFMLEAERAAKKKGTVSLAAL